MRLTHSSVLAMLPATGLASCGSAYPAANIHGTTLRSIVLDMGSDAATVTDAQYDEFFAQGNATEGVKAVIASGRFYINRWSIPGTEAAFTNATSCTSDGYLVNQKAWLSYDASSATYKGGFEGETQADSYADAALSVATGIVAGLEVRLWDVDGDGYTDLIDADYLEGTTVDMVHHNANGTYSLYRGNIDVANKTPNEGSVFDGDAFDGTGPLIAAANFDTAIRPGGVALFWYGPHGWAVKRAQQVTGIFVDGADHEDYDLDGVRYQDAMRFSRDNLLIPNRPGEFTNAQKFFGLTNDSAAGLDVSLWLVPVSNASDSGAPIGMTGDGNSADFLARSVAQAQAQLDSVVVSNNNGTEVPSGRNWVTPSAFSQLNDSIARANASLASPGSSSFLLDYQTYILYQAINGSASDIGASFGGFNYTGFANEIRSGSA